MKRTSDFGKLVLLALVVVIGFCVVAAHADAGTFTVGIAEPGPAQIPPQDVRALGLGAERRTVVWHGEPRFSGTVGWTPGLRHFLTVSAGWPHGSDYAPTTGATRSSYCAFVVSILARYPEVRDVIVWNEPNLAGFWGVGADAYVRLLTDCAPRIRAMGARVLAPALAPTTLLATADYAARISAAGPHLIDGWVLHQYDGYVPIGEKIPLIRRILGWEVPVIVGEAGAVDGPTTAWLMRKAYCAGASAWLNFKLRDNGDWRPTGLQMADGIRKPQYSAFRAEAAKIRAGRESCDPSSPRLLGPPVKQRLRRARPARHRIFWVCPERPDGSPVVRSCVKDNWP